MKNAAHRVAVSTRIKTVNGDKINAVGCDGKKEGRQLEARTRKVEGVRTKRTSNSESDSCRWYETPARRLDDATMMPGRILRLFSIAIAKHKGHTLTFSMSVVLPDRSRESPFVSFWLSASALSVADTGSGETLVFRVATIIHHALTCFPFARVDVSTGKSVPRRQSRCGPSLCGKSFRQLRSVSQSSSSNSSEEHA